MNKHATAAQKKPGDVAEFYKKHPANILSMPEWHSIYDDLISPPPDLSQTIGPMDAMAA